MLLHLETRHLRKTKDAWASSTPFRRVVITSAGSLAPNTALPATIQLAPASAACLMVAGDKPPSTWKIPVYRPSQKRCLETHRNTLHMVLKMWLPPIDLDFCWIFLNQKLKIQLDNVREHCEYPTLWCILHTWEVPRYQGEETSVAKHSPVQKTRKELVSHINLNRPFLCL